VIESDSGKNPYRWITNDQWFKSRTDDAGPLRPDFIIPQSLNTDLLRRAFGPPTQIIGCHGRYIWLYEQPLPLRP